MSKSNTADATIKVNYDGSSAESGIKKTSSSFKSLQKTVSNVVSVLALQQVLSYSASLAKMGNEAILVEKNFNRMADKVGGSADVMTKALMKVTMGVVDDTKLQQVAIKGMMAGINFDDILTGLEYVTKYTMSTGGDMASNLDSLMMAFARNSKRYLQGIGIDVEKGGDAISSATKQMRAKMGELKVSQDDASVSSARLTTKWDKQQEMLGKNIAVVYNPFIKFLNDVLPLLGKTSEAMTKFGSDFYRATHPEYAKGADKLDEKTQLMFFKGILKKKKELTIKTNYEILELNKKIAESNPIEAQGLLNQKIAKENELLVLKKEQLALENSINTISPRVKADVPGLGLPPAGKKELTQEEKDAIKKRNEERAKLELEGLWTNYEMRKDAQQKMIDDEIALQEESIQKEIDFYNKELEFVEFNSNKKISLMDDSRKKDIAETNQYYRKLEEEYVGHSEILLMLADLKGQQILDINDKWRQIELEKQQKADRDKIESTQNMLSSMDTINGAMMSIVASRTASQIKHLDNLNLSEAEYAKRKEKIEKEAAEKTRAFARVQQGIAIAQAIVNAYSAASSVLASETGGVAMKVIAAAAALTAGFANVYQIEAQNFSTGRIGEKSRNRNVDDINAVLGAGETVVPAPQSAAHESELRSIVNNTANTSKNNGKSGIAYNFYGVSTEQILNVVTDSKRKNRIGRRI